MKLRIARTFALLSALVLDGLPAAYANTIDASGMMYVEPSTNVVREGDGEGVPQQVVFTVHLGYADIARPQTVPYEIVPGTAMPGEDYEPVPAGSLVFAEGERSKAVVVNIIGDRTPECGEHLLLRLQHGGGIIDAIATIANDDGDSLDGGVAVTCSSQGPADAGTVSGLPIPLDGALAATPLDGGTAQIAPEPASVDASVAPTGPAPASGCAMGGAPGAPSWLAGVALLLLALARRRGSSR